MFLSPEVYSKSGGSWLPAEIIQAEADTVKVRYMVDSEKPNEKQPGSHSGAGRWVQNHPKPKERLVFYMVLTMF